MIEFNNISKKFKTDFWKSPIWALKKVDFKVEEGKITGLIGANGAGKTTLIKILFDLIRPTSGYIHYNKSLGETSLKRKKNIGLLPEKPYFAYHLKGIELLYFLGKLHGLGTIELKTKINKWSEKLNISHNLDQTIRTYSKGMMQRLALISVLVNDPKVVVLDEPLSGLDPIGRKIFKDIILELVDEGKSVFFSSHIVPDIEEVCDNLVCLKDGEIVYQGKVKELLSKYVKPNFEITAQLEEIKRTDLIKKFNPKKINQLGYRFEVDEYNKLPLIKNLIELNASIESINLKKLTLEDVYCRIHENG